MELNAVEQRMVHLQSRWQAFRARDTKRMLLWQTQENATRLMEAFFEAQRHESLLDKPYACGDTFIVFDSPFEDSISYSRQLKQALAGQYEASHESFTQAGHTADWRFSPNSLPDSAHGFVQGLNALAQHHQEVLGMLVAVILPGSLSKPDAWTAWLGRALQAAAPAQGVRLIVIDSTEHPRCTHLIKSDPNQLHVEPIPIDAFELAGETFAQEPAVGPPGVFRSLLVGLLALVERASPDQVMLKANDAIAFARRLGWGDQEVAVRMMAAGALLKAQRFDEAVIHYRHARSTAEKLIEEDHPAARDLVLQTWFGEASAHFAANNLPAAIGCYRDAEPVAEAIAKPILWIECLRMGAYCHQRNGEEEAAMQCCQRALHVGERMKPDARGMTTLPLVAMETLRLLDPKLTQRIERIKQTLDADLNRLNDTLEQEACRLEQDPNGAEALKTVEQSLSSKSDSLEQIAEREIDKLATTGEPSFRQAFERIRTLLWRAWPLDPSPQEAPATDNTAQAEEARA
jgi:tetratricopeptide (TPR) repeat protein